MSRKLFLFALALLVAGWFLASSQAFWGANGHRIVGYIAQQHLTPKTERAVEQILGPESLARAATWPDEIRSDPTWDFAKPWHFVSVDDDETLDETARDPNGDVLAALECFEGVLRDPAAAHADKVVAMRFFVHFVGDVHQPLHVGRRDDRGGNSVRVRFFGDHTNLHSVWDSGLLENEGLSFTEMARFLNHPTREQIHDWQMSTYKDWAQESFEVRGKVYGFGDKKDSHGHPDLSYQYAYHAMPVIRERLLHGGVRLAGVLNSIFDPADPGSTFQYGNGGGAEIGCADLGTRHGVE